MRQGNAPTILDERLFPSGAGSRPLASRRSVGTELSYGDKTLNCKDLRDVRLLFGVDASCLMSRGAATYRKNGPRAKIAKAGAIGWQTNSVTAWRMDPDVPLIVPEVNADASMTAYKKGIIANPTAPPSSTVVALILFSHPPCTMQPESTRVGSPPTSPPQGRAGRGRHGRAVEADRAIYVNDPIEPNAFIKQIAST